MSLAAILLLGLAAFLVGFSKTAISGAATVAIVLFASQLPARESTGALLVLLMVGDAIAVWTYRRHGELALIRRLIVPVLFGVAVGAAFLALTPTSWMKPVIGAIVVAMTLIQAWRMWHVSRMSINDAAHHPLVANGFGGLAGFTTMVANAGGPVMTLYLLWTGLDVTRFVGTLAWFFASVNLVKLPISITLGLVRPQRLVLCLALVPAVVLGAIVGRWVIARLSRELFERIVLVVAGISGLYLMLS